MESKEHALRGWNWGKTEFTKAELCFNVQNRPAFELPYSEVSNTNLAGKNEVSVEFALGDGDANANQSAGSTRNRGRKAAAGPDELVEMRFYIPGTVSKKDKSGEGGKGPDGKVKKEDGEEDEEAGGEEDDDEGEEQNAANLFYETLMDKAEIGDVAGDTFAMFLDVLHLTPRYEPALNCMLYFPLICLQEVVSISTCTNLPSGYEERRTTTRSNTPRSKNSSYSPKMTIHIRLLFWDSTLLFGRARQDTHSLSCS